MLPLSQELYILGLKRSLPGSLLVLTIRRLPVLR